MAPKGVFFRSFNSLASNYPLLPVQSPAVQFCLKHVSGEEQKGRQRGNNSWLQYRSKQINQSRDFLIAKDPDFGLIKSLVQTGWSLLYTGHFIPRRASIRMTRNHQPGFNSIASPPTLWEAFSAVTILLNIPTLLLEPGRLLINSPS